MKKIFAIILATIMVMSLVPASVFAAITNDTACEKYHTVKNCEYTELGFVEATCTTPSYTAYKCNKCGEQFADNFGTAALGHKLDKDNQTDTNKNTDPNCATETNGKKYVKCSVCDYVPTTADGYGDGYVVVKYAHNWKAVSGVGCETVYECTNANCKHTKTDDHDWKYTKVTLEPKWEAGKYIAGEALFTCKDCKDTKTVQILDVACKCKEKVLVQAAVANTCTEDGSYAIYKCADCYQLYILVAKDDYKPIDKIDSKDVVIPNKGGHVEKANSKKTNGCDVSYVCDDKQGGCGQTIVTKVHQNIEAQDKLSSKPTCTTMGYEYLLCKACGEYEVKPLAATGHKTTTKTVDATCATAGVIYTLCCNENCSAVAQTTITVTKDGKLYNKVVKTETIPTNDNHKPYVMYNGKKVYDAKELPGATCEMGVVYVWTCDNGCATYFEVDQRPAAGHKMELTVESHNCAKKTTTLAAWTTRVALKCSVCGVTSNTDYVNANSNVMFATKEEAEVFHGIAFKNTDAKGNVTYTYRDGKNANSLGTPVSTPGNCTVPSYDIYTCPTCGSFVYVNTGIQGHKATAGKDVAYTAAKCDKTGTVAHSICALCDAKFVQNADGTQTTLTTTTINKCASTLETKTTNCDKVTYEQCTKCLKTYTDKTASTAYTVPADAHAWKDIKVGNIATCNTAGEANVKYCTACKTLEVNRIYKNMKTGEVEVIKLAADDAKFEGAQITVTLINGAEFVIEANGTVKDNKANNATLAFAKLEHTDPTTGKSTIEKRGESEGKADHTKVGYEHNECTYCAYEYLTKYTPATGGHVNAKGEILTEKCSNASVKDRVCVVCEETIKTAHTFKHVDEDGKQADITVPATCVDEGYTYNYCTECATIVVTGKMAIDKNVHADLVGLKANYAQAGYSEQPCAACGFAGKVDDTIGTKKGIEVLLSYTVNGHESDYAALGSIITVTVDLGSLNGVNVWGGKFDIEYNPSVLEFITDSVSFSNEIGFNTRIANDVMVPESYFDMESYQMVYTGKIVPAGKVSVAVQADNANIAIKGTKNLLTLQFKVVAAVEQGYYSTQISVTKDSVDFITETGASVAAMWNTTNYVAGSKETDGIELVEILDVKANGTYDMADALAIYTLILFNEYDAAADINADGKVDAEDLRVFYAILTGATTVADYFKPVDNTAGGTTPIQPRA